MNAKPHLLVVPHCCSIFLSLHIIAESILDRLDSHRVFVDEYHYEDASSSRLQRRQRRQHNKHPRSHHQRSKSSGDALTMAAALEALSSDDDDGQRSIESWSLPTLGTLLPTPLPAYLQGVILLSVVLPPISNYVVRTYVRTNMNDDCFGRFVVFLTIRANRRHDLCVCVCVFLSLCLAQ